MAIIATADETQRQEENRSAVRPAAATAGPAAALEEAKPVTGDELHQVRFSALENIAYHAAREQFLARAAKLLTGLPVLLGTGAVAMLSQALPGSAPLTMVLAALAGVIMLVTDPAAAAREHRIFRARYHGLVAEIDEAGADQTSAGRARAQISRISADEPPVYRAVQAIAYNAAINALYPEDQAKGLRYRIGALQRLFAHVLPMRGATFSIETV
jgi:hypothetical protein